MQTGLQNLFYSIYWEFKEAAPVCRIPGLTYSLPLSQAHTGCRVADADACAGPFAAAGTACK